MDANFHQISRDGRRVGGSRSPAAAPQGCETSCGDRDSAPADHGLRRIRVNGIVMNVLVAGQGPDVLLVHGFPDTHEVWRRQIPVLVQAGYRVIAPDTRGCGDSDIPPSVADYRLDKLVADLVALLDALAISRVRLVAHDWGAVIAWQMAIGHPERVERYVALSVGHPAAYASMEIEQKLRGWYVLFFQLRGVAEAALRFGGWSGLRWLTRFAEELPQWRRSLCRPGRLTAAINYYRGNLGLLRRRAGDDTVAVPVHGIWSSEDRFLTERQMRSSERYVSGGWRYTRVEGANHWMQLDAAERLNPLLLDSLR